MATITRYKKKGGGISYTAQIRIKRGGKVIHSESFTGPKLALVKAWAKKREAKLAEPGVLEALSYAVTVGKVLKWYREFSENAGRTKASTIEFLMKQPIAELDAVKLTVEQCLDYAASRKPASPATILQDFIWLRLAMNSYRLAHNAPVAAQAVEDAMTLLRASRVIAEPNKRDRRPTLDELDRLLEYFDSRSFRQRIPMVEVALFAMFSARRQSEITRLRPLDRDGERILVRGMKHPGGVRDTWVFLTDEACAILDRQPKGEFYFPYNPRSISAAFRVACNFLEIPDLHFHDLRHECTSWLFELGWDIPRVSGVTGHKSWSSLQRYTHLRERGVRDKYHGWQWRP